MIRRFLAEWACVVVILSGCAGPTNQTAGGDAMNAGVASVKGDLRLGRDVTLARLFDLHKESEINFSRRWEQSIGDKFSERMAIGGAILMGLSYPAGKLIWLLTGGACNHVATRIKRPFIRARLRQ